jgi:methionine sulfoxide reductase heme-binding subunit
VSWLVATPSPLWFADRGTGAVTLLLLTVSVVLGLGTTVRWHSAVWPRYLNAALHRNVSLMVLCFLVVHIATAILDPFAHLGLRDALVPFSSSYRPLWLGLGVVAAELTAALVLSSATQPLIGYRAWRLLHWLAYAAWPVAVLHGLGTGTDARSSWLLILTFACVAAVWLALISWRLSFSEPKNTIPRLLLAAAATAAVVLLAIWTITGPLQPGWASIAGTPPSLLKSHQP